jgi:hypothetical protein
MTTSANRSEADETTRRPETRFHKKNQAELVLAQLGFFNTPGGFSGVQQFVRLLEKQAHIAPFRRIPPRSMN